MTKVIIQECRDYSLMNLMQKINEGMERLGGWSQFCKPGDRVLLKPNLIGPKPSESAAITHCELIRAMIRMLKQQGCTVWIGDSSGGAIAGISPTAQSFKVSGYDAVAKEEGAEIKNFDSEGVVAVQPESKCEDNMYLAKPIFDADVVINLPKLKTHSAAIYTGAVKNLFGCIPGLRKAKYHKMAPDQGDFGQIIADIHRATKFSLHIMDSIQAMQGEGPTAGEIYQANKILISTDPLALDAIAAKMIGMELADIPILVTARDRRLGEGSLENIKIEGDYQLIPELDQFQFPKGYRRTKKVNSRIIVKVIDFLRTQPRVNMKKCKGCNVCVESCPVKAIHQDTKIINYQRCIECMCCHELCMHRAVDLKKKNFLADIVTSLYRGRYR